jgi:hypothetical protein
VRDRRTCLEDCHPVGRSDRINGVPTILNFAKDIWVRAGGGSATFVEILKKSMSDGGRWVWQADRLTRAPNRARLHSQRGRGSHQPYGHTRAPQPSPFPQQNQQKPERDRALG